MMAWLKPYCLKIAIIWQNMSKFAHYITCQPLKAVMTARVELKNSDVRHEAVVLAAKYPGDHSIDLICSIYGYLKRGRDEIYFSH